MIAVADPERVRQIIRILLDNALTHTPEGTSVTVTIYSVNQRAELTVSDDGTGHPPAARRSASSSASTPPTPPAAPGSDWRSRASSRSAWTGRIAISSSRRFTAFTLDLPLAPSGRRRRRLAEPAKATA